MKRCLGRVRQVSTWRGTFPKPQDWMSVPVDSPSRNSLIAITGGTKIEGILPWDRTDIVGFSGSAIKPLEEQSSYANSVARTKIEGLIANAPPGVRKTVMIAGTVIHSIRN
ncbi:hypothetical protein B9Z55_025600 [Caenorhabditis nigoni]|uniref:Uncharacterized protein n=1 Tax=Caenorhabditis nigoni TaxID=1611254 RepID=A0A2G5SZB3_9PELO|nr:hypothetical protein B9Z55_025600 [Caenorhabditis nigoni]